MIDIIKGGNLIEAPEFVIAHQVNCQSAMGSGVALAIKNMYPKHYADYMKDKRTPEQKLGTILFTYNIKPQKFIYGLYGQLHYSNRSVCNTDYNALESSLKYMICDANSQGQVDDFALPWGIGCGLAGGDWKIVKNILTNISNEYSVNFHLYDLMNQSGDE